MSTAIQPQDNLILSALRPSDWERINSQLKPIELLHSAVIYRPGDVIEHLYFPTGSMISLINQLSDGSSVETGVTGYEGLVGIFALLGVDESPQEAIVQFPGSALKVKTDDLKSEFQRAGTLHDLLLRYLRSLFLQTSQIAACNRLHTIPERLARWLLMSRDRCRCDELPFTQEFLALMLGTRRAGVTESALILQADGYIKYSRGHITISDAEGLENYSCECYAVLKEDFKNLSFESSRRKKG